MSWNRDRKADPVLLVVQFFVCVVTWTVVVLLLEGAVSRSGFVASVVDRRAAVGHHLADDQARPAALAGAAVAVAGELLAVLHAPIRRRRRAVRLHASAGTANDPSP